MAGSWRENKAVQNSPDSFKALTDVLIKSNKNLETVEISIKSCHI